MRILFTKVTVPLVACVMLIVAPQPAKAVPVSIELSLLIDVSGSVDNGEFLLQRTGYVNAFQSAAIHALIAATPNGIAVNFIQWSGTGEQAQSVAWTHLTDAASSNAFAALVNGAGRAYSGNTAPGSAINFAVPLFTNGFEGDRQVIDVSGDGVENEGANTATARANALAAGIDQINGLAIGGAAITAFYVANIQGGAGAFTVGVDDFGDFQAAINTKLFRELGGEVPVPPSAILMGLGGLGFIGSAWRRRKLMSV